MNIFQKVYSVAKKINWPLVIITFGITLIGIIVLYSATHTTQFSKNAPTFWKQLIWISISGSLFIFMTFFNYRFFRKIIYIIYGLNMLALIAVPFFGKTVYGAKRWLDIGIANWQPSESMKLVLIILTAHLISKVNRDNLSFKHILKIAAFILPPTALILKQPDLGTAALSLFTPALLILFYKVEKKVLITGLLALVITLPLGWKYGLKDYQKQRILTFVSSDKDSKGSGYNSIQSKVTIGSGKFLGKGFQQGTQSQLEFIPERHTDFIFSVLNEEFGFLGGGSLMLLFFLLSLCGFYIAAEATSRFSLFLASGISLFISSHVFINAAMVTGIIPIVGVALPLVSYGGSTMLTNFLALGILSSISYRQKIF